MRHAIAKLIAWIATRVDGDADCPCHVCDITEDNQRVSRIVGF